MRLGNLATDSCTLKNYYSTFKKIDISEDDKVSAISEASKILLDVLHRYEAVYADPNNKPQLDEFSPGFVPGIRKAYCDMIQLLSKISPSSFDGLIEIIANECSKELLNSEQKKKKKK